jgi:hypothetical protein
MHEMMIKAVVVLVNYLIDEIKVPAKEPWPNPMRPNASELIQESNLVFP